MVPDDRVGAIEQNHRGRDALAFGVRDDLRFAVGVDVGDRGEGGAKVNADCFSLSHMGQVEKLTARLSSFTALLRCNFHAGVAAI